MSEIRDVDDLLGMLPHEIVAVVTAERARTAALEVENAALREALALYGGHIETACCDVEPDAPCVCGLDALLASEPGQYGAAVLEAGRALADVVRDLADQRGVTWPSAQTALDAWDRALRRRMAGEDA